MVRRLKSNCYIHVGRSFIDCMKIQKQDIIVKQENITYLQGYPGASVLNQRSGSLSSGMGKNKNLRKTSQIFIIWSSLKSLCGLPSIV